MNYIAVAVLAALLAACSSAPTEPEALDRLALSYIQYVDPTLTDAQRQEVLASAVPDLLRLDDVTPTPSAVEWADERVVEHPELEPWRDAIASARTVIEQQAGGLSAEAVGKLALYAERWQSAGTTEERGALVVEALDEFAGTDVSGVEPSAAALLFVSHYAGRNPQMGLGPKDVELLARLLTLARGL